LEKTFSASQEDEPSIEIGDLPGGASRQMMISK